VTPFKFHKLEFWAIVQQSLKDHPIHMCNVW